MQKGGVVVYKFCGEGCNGRVLIESRFDILRFMFGN